MMEAKQGNWEKSLPVEESTGKAGILSCEVFHQNPKV